MTKARDLADIVAAGSPLVDGTIEVVDITGVTASATELNYTDGVTSNIQTQVDSKLPLSGGTLTGALNLGDSTRLRFGDSQDFEIYHDGTNTNIENTTGSFHIRNSSGGQIKLQAVSGEQGVVVYANSAVELYYDNSLKLSTQNYGVSINGTLAFNDNNKAVFGTSDDLQLFHDGSNSYIQNNTGNLIIKNSGGDYLKGIVATGGVELNYNNSKKLETTSTGVDITGNISVSGTVDGRDIASDGSKLDGIESGATADQTKADIDALNIDAATLDSLDSTQFMRSDTADSFTANPTFAAGATGQLASRTGYADFLGYNPTYGSYIGGGGGNSTRYLYSGGYIYNGSATHTLWHSGNDGSGSGLDADLWDGNQFSSYLNQAVTTTSSPTFANVNSTGGSVTATNFYAHDWYRNYNTGEGLYNEATGNHWASNSSTNWTARTSQSYNQIEFQTNGTSRRGSVYATSSNEFGLLDADNSWAIKHVHDNRTEFYINGTEYMQIDGSNLTVQHGSIVLNGTGRIQGVDTVSSGTDAANKNYVDTAVASAGGGGTAFSAF